MVLRVACTKELLCSEGCVVGNAYKEEKENKRDFSIATQKAGFQATCLQEENGLKVNTLTTSRFSRPSMHKLPGAINE